MNNAQKSIHLPANWFLVGLLGAILLGFVAPTMAAAPFRLQTDGFENDPAWAPPVNVSQSGAASEPRVAVDSNGRAHVIWREDEAGSFFYSVREDGVWQAPVPVRLPAQSGSGDPPALYDPILLADGLNRIHAFWKDEDGRLFHSAVPAEAFATPNQWRLAQPLAESAVVFSVAADDSGNVYLGYVRDLDAEGAPAGIYFRQLPGESQVWNESQLIFESAYFRTVSADEANVDVSATSPPQATATSNDTPDANTPVPATVILAWDNPLQERVYVATSRDSGASWDAPVVVDARAPEDTAEDVGPNGIASYASGSEAHLTWIAGHNSGCEQFHQWSQDGGRSWSAPASILAAASPCPSASALLSGASGMLFLMSRLGAETYLRAWNGTAWSDPEPQAMMSQFWDTETVRRVDLGCTQSTTSGDDLVVVGCRDHRVSDVWLLERPLGSESDWFPAPEEVVWRAPAVVFGDDEIQIEDPVLLSLPNGRTHAFWIVNQVGPAAGSTSSIYYIELDGASSSRVVPLLALPHEKADRLTGVVEDHGRIGLFWRDATSNIYYHSFVDPEDVLLPTLWSVAEELVGSEQLVSEVALTADGADHVFTAYAVPLNEARGIYLQHMTDDEPTWSEPILVADAVAMDWDMVDLPQVLQGKSGRLHAIWTRFNLRPEPLASELLYAYSDDGESWTEPVSIAKGDIRWSRIGKSGGGSVLAVWQQLDGEQTSIWSRQSLDGGKTWEEPRFVLGVDTLIGTPALAVDTADQVHLAQVVSDDAGDLSLRDWTWGGEAWAAGDSLLLDMNTADVHIHQLAINPAPDGLLTIAFTVERVGADASSESLLYLTARDYDLPTDIVAATPSPQAATAVSLPALESVPTAIPTEIPVAVPTAVAEIAITSNSPTALETAVELPSDSPYQGLAFELLMAGGLVIVTIGLMSFGVARLRRRF